MRCLDEETFVAEFGSVYEHSSWVAAGVFRQAMDDCMDTTSLAAADLCKRFAAIFSAATQDQQLATLRAHPQLACVLDERERLTADSRAEQSGAGLDSCSAAEFSEFARLNADYGEKFGFPFIIAVKGRGRQEILQAFRERFQNDAEVEFVTALEQVGLIAQFRIEGMIGDK